MTRGNGRSTQRADTSWETLKPKIDDYIKIMRFGFWIFAGIVSIFITVILSMLAIPGVKPAIVSTLIVNVKDEVKAYFEEDRAKAFLRAQTERYLQSEQGKKLLEDETIRFLRTERAQEALNAHFKSNLKIYLDSNTFKGALYHQLGRTVAYSYSSVFELSDNKRDHIISLFKPEGGNGEMRCTATYPNTTLTNRISVIFNNQTEPRFRFSRRDSRSNVTTETFALPSANSELFQKHTRASDYHKIQFVVDADKPFDGAITLDCTVTVVGVAPWGG